MHQIYDYVSKTSNLPQISPSLLEITHETLLPNGGYSYRWKYKMAGIRLSAIGECIQISPNALLISKNIGDFEIVNFRFQCYNTHAGGAFIYVPAAGILSNQLTENIVLRMNYKKNRVDTGQPAHCFEDSLAPITVPDKENRLMRRCPKPGLPRRRLSLVYCKTVFVLKVSQWDMEYEKAITVLTGLSKSARCLTTDKKKRLSPPSGCSV